MRKAVHMLCGLALLGFTAAPALFAAAPGERVKYYINKGTKYHIGDNRFSLSEDSNFLDSFPVVGQEWVVYFTVDQDDDVEVQIDKIWGVDDCPYCKIIITIDNFDMGRLFNENNRRPFTTPDPLWFKARAGQKHMLKIASYGQQRVDDFVVQDVAVISAARLKYEGPTYIAPVTAVAPPPPPAPVVGTCRGSKAAGAWMPSDAVSRGTLKLASVGDFNDRELAAALAPGDYIEANLRVNKVEGGDAVGQAVELVLGKGDTDGWVLQFAPGQDRLLHTNVKRHGAYRAQRFRGSSYRPQQWNIVRLARCPDGKAALFINGSQVGEAIPLEGPLEPVAFRVRGLTAELAAKAY